MFGDIFDTTEQLLSGEKEGGQIQTSWERLPKNCADELPLPQKQRKLGYPIGLKNQGCTCYLNSLLQILYFTPQFRQLILQLPLCKQTLEKKSEFLENQSKHRFLMGFQRLFSQMMLRDVNSLSTDFINKAFGWGEEAEHLQQQDIQEAMRIIFDTVERALVDTKYEERLRTSFKGVISNYKECKACTVRSERLEDFFDMIMQVKNMSSLGSALTNFMTPESMDGDNKITCDVCESKQDAWLGRSVKNLPNTLIFSLNRFEFDYQKLDRIKVNDYFQFDLETQLQHLIVGQKPQELKQEFQLYGVLIHRGSAHGGHYLCYVRDLMKQSQWTKTIKQTQQTEKKRKQQRETEQLTAEQKKKRDEREKEEKQFQLKQPSNKRLLENWYEIDDSVSRAINPHIITSKYVGSQSAYILFYRRKNIPLPENIIAPEYFSTPIKQQNQELSKARESYEFEKQHIILKINAETVKINKNTRISELKQIYCPLGYTLVNEGEHLGLPYYPMELSSMVENVETDTIESLQIVHGSTWNAYEIDGEEYKRVRDSIGREKIPFLVTLLYISDEGQKKNKKITLYQNQTLSDLRKRLQKQYKVPYETQMIKLVTPYKQSFITENLSNDELLLTKLGFVSEAQIILKSLHLNQNQMQQQQVNKTGQQEQVISDLICFIIERDDQMGIKRMYFDKHAKLQELLQHVMKVEGMSTSQKRRFRNMNGNRLYYVDHYRMSLQELNFGEDMVKFRIQRGDIPIKGDVCVKFKMQSQYQQETTPEIVQHLCDPNCKIADLKKWVCQQHGLDPQNHKIYLTDWMEQPNIVLTKENRSVFEASFGRQETVCLRDNQSPIASQLLHFEIFFTQNGSPQTVGNTSFFVKVQQQKTLLQFKQQLLKTKDLQDRNLNPKQLRLRQIKKDYMFGVIWKNHTRQLKDIEINNNKLAVQVMRYEEELSEDQVVILLKKRNSQKRLYEEGMEMIFEGGISPTIEDFQMAVRKKLEISEGAPFKLIKYFNYNFEWVQICQKTLAQYLLLKNKKKDQKTQNQKGKNHEKQFYQNQKKQEVRKGERAHKPNNQDRRGQQISTQNATKQPKQNESDNRQKPIQKQEVVHDNDNRQKKNKNIEKKQQVNSQKQRQNNDNKPKKENKKDAKKEEDCFNIRRAPILLKDGDWIGYGLVDELGQDDLQTEQDLTLRTIRDQEKLKPGKKVKRGNQKGFQLKVDF